MTEPEGILLICLSTFCDWAKNKKSMDTRCEILEMELAAFIVYI